MRFKPFNIGLFILALLPFNPKFCSNACGQSESKILTIESPWNTLPEDFEMAYIGEKLFFSANIKRLSTEDYSVLYDPSFSYTRYIDFGVSGNLKNPHVSEMKSISDSIVLVGVTQYGGKTQSLSTTFIKITENLIINQFPIGKGIGLSDVDDIGDGVFVCGQYTDSSFNKDGFFCMLFPLNASKTSSIYTLNKLHPESIQALSDSTVLLSGSAFDSINNSWITKSFLGILNTSGKWDYFREISIQGEFNIKKAEFEKTTGLIHLSGELHGLQSRKKDVFYGITNPSSDTSIQLLVFGGENFEILEDLVVSDSLIFLLGSSEFYGNGIDQPFCARVKRDLTILSFEVMEQSFRGKAMAGKIKDGKIHVLGYKDNINENWESFEAIADPEAERIFCNSSIYNPNFFFMQMPLDSKRPMLKVNPLTQFDSILGGSSWPTQQIIYCNKALCPDSLSIEYFENPICQGDTIVFHAFPKIQVDWYHNGNYLATDSMVKIIFTDTGIHEIFLKLNDGSCFREANSVVKIDPAPEIHLLGPSWICPNTGPSGYSINGNDLDTIMIDVTGGDLISFDGTTISIEWKSDPAQLTIETTNKFGCKARINHFIRLDSVMDPLPKINSVSWIGDSIICHIETSNWADLQQRNIAWNTSGTWQDLGLFSENREYYYKPPEGLKKGLGFRIKAIDHCGIEVPSLNHRSIFLYPKNNKYVTEIAWDPYEGWEMPPGYSLFQTGRLFLDSVPFVIETEFAEGIYETDILVEISEKKCYRIKGSDKIWETLSNELCIEGIAHLFVSNIVTPNGDGKNDALTAKAAFDISNLQWQIFSRSGNLILRFEGPPTKINYSQFSSGIYYYLAVSEKGGNWKGWFQIIK